MGAIRIFGVNSAIQEKSKGDDVKGIVLGFLWLNLIIGAVIYEKIKPVEVIKEVKIEVPVIKEVNTDFKEFKIKKDDKKV